MRSPYELKVNPAHVKTSWKLDVRLPGIVNSKSHGARPVHQIIAMIKWIRTSRFSMKNSLSLKTTLSGTGQDNNPAQGKTTGEASRCQKVVPLDVNKWGPWMLICGVSGFQQVRPLDEDMMGLSMMTGGASGCRANLAREKAGSGRKCL